MKRKELKISPIPEDSKFYKVYAHILLLWPFAPIIIALVIFSSVGDETRSKIMEEFMKEKVLLTLVIIHLKCSLKSLI